MSLTYSCFAVATTKVTLWNAHNPSAYLDAAIQQYEQSHDVLIEKNNFLSEKLREEVLNQARTNTLPDILYVPSDFVGMHDLISLTPVPKDWLLPTTDARVLGAGYTDGHQYGIPLFQGNHLVLYYNKSLVKQPVDNWSELLKQQSQFTEKGLQTIVWNYSEMYWFIPFLTAFDGWPIDNGKVTLDTPQMRSALAYYKQLKDLGLVDPNCDHDCSVQRFKDGEAAYMINGDWIYNDLKQNLGEQLGVSLLPNIEGKPMLPMFSGYVLSFPRLSTSDHNYQHIKSFALYMQSNAAQDIIYREGGLLPSNVDVLQQQTAEQTENDKNMLKQMESTKAMPSDREMTIVWLAIQRGFNRYLEHHYSIDQATQLMQKIADKEVAKLGTMK
ncbi:sugar ABC transporter substrate-binding protein [Agarivorans sp. MS3-6]|uniref:sugar ABC transporter substrate-binding protein n=1 Tax=Agarivorans sp. TSD2052 TaxID=2937286 RepID=UPI00200BECDE|nr:extracellular solute-binding protein [Agarivorans sp. TSD2052]UPW16749.1 extracellular solute-binding protein [Agarivorans sp. TSD2052]